MSKITANAALSFVAAYDAADKSSIKMVSACIRILADNTPASAVVASVRGAYESKHGAFNSTIEAKKFETLVSQRSFAAQLVRIVCDADAATDELAIKAALRVASGAIPRKAALAIADSLKGSNDGPAFDAATREAVKNKTPQARAAAGTTAPRATEPETVRPADRDAVLASAAFGDALKIIDRVIRETKDAKVRNEMRKALQARMIKVSQEAPVPA